MLRRWRQSSPRPRGSRLERAILPLGLAIVVLIACLPALAGRVPFPAHVVLEMPPWAPESQGCCDGVSRAEFGDIATQFYPWRAEFNAALGRLDLPIWNHQILMGTPFLAESTPGVFFPLNALFGVLPASAAWTTLFLLRYFIVAASTALFARRLGLTPTAAAVAAVGFAFSGWVVAFNGRPHLDSAMWLPLMLWAVDRLADRQTAERATTLAGAFSLSVLGGHPEVAAQVLFLTCLFGLYRWTKLAGRRLRFAGAFTAAAALSVALSAMQVLPTAEWLPHLTRDLSIRWPPFDWSQVRGLVSRDLLGHPNADGVLIPEAASYAGYAVIALAVLSLLMGARRHVLAMLLIGSVSFALVFGLPPVSWVVEYIPVINGLPNTRFLVGVNFAIAMLAGVGLHALQQRARAGYGAGARAITLASIVVALGVAVEMVTYMRPYMPWMRAADVFPSNPTFDFLQRVAGAEHRVAAVDVTYGSNFEVPYGLTTATGYDFPTRRPERVLRRLSLSSSAVSFDSAKLLELPPGILNLTGTRFLVATEWNAGASRLQSRPDRFTPVFKDGMVTVFANNSGIPLVSLQPASAIRVIVEEEAQFSRLFAEDFDPSAELVLPSAVARYHGRHGTSTVTRIDGVRRTGSHLTVDVRTEKPALLYVNEALYEGFSVSVDGTPADLLRANYTFTAVAISPGVHSVRISYLTPGVRYGLAISAVTFVLVSGVWIRAGLARGRRRAAVS